MPGESWHRPDPGQLTIVEAIQTRSEGGALFKRLSDLRLDHFGVRLLGLNRHEKMPGINLRTARLRAADRLLLEGTREGLAAAAAYTNLTNITQPRSRSFRRRKAPLAILGIAAVVFFAAMDVMPIEGLAILAVASMLALRCIDTDEAWQSIDANVLVLIFSMLAIGIGLQKTGTVEVIVGFLDPLLRMGSPMIVLFSVYFLTVILTELITNNAVAVILAPIAIGLADSLGLDARPLVVAVMFGASSSFATPIGYQTNTMVYGAGDYRFSDFLKIGIFLDIIVGIANCITISLVFPLVK
jgi:di/tricarboxylate transporter